MRCPALLPAILPLERAVEALSSTKSVVIVPGCGMAIGQAQFKVNELAQALEKAGKEGSLCDSSGGRAHAGAHERSSR